MKDPLLCTADAKSKIETANGVDQLDYISSLVTDYKIENIRESQILELHKVAVVGVFGCGGTYRDALAQVRISDSEHEVPEAAFVPSHLQELLYMLNSKEHSTSALRRAAYALWRFNWIHPFRGGNGRTSRATSSGVDNMGVTLSLILEEAFIVTRRDNCQIRGGDNPQVIAFASRALGLLNFHNHIVKAGGDTYASGSRGGNVWMIGVANPDTLAYLIVCMDLGAMIPGDVTVPSLIYDRRDEYVSSLKIADKGLRDTGEPDLGAMEALVKDVIVQQMAMAVSSLGSLA